MPVIANVGDGGASLLSHVFPLLVEVKLGLAVVYREEVPQAIPAGMRLVMPRVNLPARALPEWNSHLTYTVDPLGAILESDKTNNVEACSWSGPIDAGAWNCR